MTATLPDFALEVYLGHHEFSATHYLCGSDAQTLTVRELLDLASDEERAAFVATEQLEAACEAAMERVRAIGETDLVAAFGAATSVSNRLNDIDRVRAGIRQVRASLVHRRREQRALSLAGLADELSISKTLVDQLLRAAAGDLEPSPTAPTGGD